MKQRFGLVSTRSEIDSIFRTWRLRASELSKFSDGDWAILIRTEYLSAVGTG